MRKLISLSEKDWLSGLSLYPNSSLNGLFSTAIKFNPYIDVGTIAFSKTPDEVTGITGNPLDFVTHPTTGKIYTMTSTGQLFEMASISSSSVTEKTSGAISNTTGDIETFSTVTGATNYLWYWQTTQIGRYDYSSTFVNNKLAITTNYQASKYYTHRINDRIYFGANNYVSMIYDDGTNADAAISLGVFDIPQDEKIKSISDDGYYLVIAASNASGVSIYFWDWRNNLDSWTRKWTIKESDVFGLESIAGVMYAKCSHGLYAFNFSTPPKNIVDVDLAVSNGTGVMNNVLLLPSTNSIYSFGKWTPGSNNALLKPFSFTIGGTGLITAIDFNHATYGLVGTSDGKLFKQNYRSGDTSYGGDGLQLTTASIPLPDYYSLTKIVFIFSGPLTSGDSFVYKIGSDEAFSNIYSTGTIAQTTYGSRQQVVAYLSPNVQCDSIYLDLSSFVGSFRIKKIEIYGEEFAR